MAVGKIVKAVKKLADEWDEAAWLKENPRPFPDKKHKDLTPEEVRVYNAWVKRKYRAKDPERAEAVRKRSRAKPEVKARHDEYNKQ